MSVEVIINRTERKVSITVERAGIKGDAGKSAYQSYLDTTTDNPVLTEAEWSERAEGPQGEQGEQGPIGPEGPKGDDGVTTVVGGVARNELRYNEYFSENEYGPISSTTGENLAVNNIRLRSSTRTKLSTGNYTISTESTSRIVPYFIFFYKDSAYVRNVNNTTISIDNANENEIRILFRKPNDSEITQQELDNLKVIVSNDNNVGYLNFQGRLRYIEKFDIPSINDKVNNLDSYDIPKIKAKTDQLIYNLHNSKQVLGRFLAPTDNVTASTQRLVDTSINDVVNGLVKIQTQSNYGLVAQLVIGYKYGVFVPDAFPSTFDISEFTIDTNIVNGVKLQFRKSDNSIITQSEIDDLKVFMYQENYTGYDRVKNNIKTLQFEIKTTKQSYWQGKKLTVLGDSISWGYIPANSPNNGTQGDSYAKIVALKLGMTLDNRGIPGSTVGAPTIGDNGRSPFVYRYGDITNEQDLIVIMGGTNDIRFINNLGEFSDTDETSFYGALHILCLGILNKFRIQQGTSEGAKKNIVLCTPIRMLSHDLSPYAAAIKEVGKYYSIPVWDAFNLSGITPHVLRTVQGTQSPYTDIYNPYITDGTHPTPDGQKIMAKAFEGFLNTIS